MVREWPWQSILERGVHNNEHWQLTRRIAVARVMNERNLASLGEP